MVPDMIMGFTKTKIKMLKREEILEIMNTQLIFQNTLYTTNKIFNKLDKDIKAINSSLKPISDSMLTAIRSYSNHVLYDSTIQWYRRNGSNQWIPFDMNGTYAELIKEHPEDYNWTSKQLTNNTK